MTFLHPDFIYLMLPILIILFVLLVTQSEKYEQFFSLDALKRLRVESDQLSSRARNIFYFLMLFFLVIALAEPVLERGSARIVQDEQRHYIVIDGSVNGVEQAVSELQQILERYRGVEVGLMLFDERLKIVSPVTSDTTLLQERLCVLDDCLQRSEHVSAEIEAETLFTGDGQYFLQLIESGDEEVTLTRIRGLYEGVSVSAVSFVEMEERLKRLSMYQKEVLRPIYFHLFVLPIGFAMLMFIFASSSFYRGEQYHLPILLSILLFGIPERLDAALWNDTHLQEAKAAYQKGDYLRSARIYESYGIAYESRESIYNAANGYYRAGSYARAVALYQSINFVDETQNRMLYYNLGNAFVKRGETGDLQRARKSYEKALSIAEDRVVRENFDGVYHMLKKVRQTPRLKHLKTYTPPSSKEKEKEMREQDDKRLEVLLRRASENNGAYCVKRQIVVRP